MNQLVDFHGYSPRLGARVFIADTARVIGNVELSDDVNIWFGSVLRGDVGKITIGARSNVQDL
ncbi:MAG TPA: gamma carbonic anhydrase family protein, partial [Polyangiaceae bacterium]|nr:gamma carbonic anhydrase family protein [Polyangiaceae bacterium]